LKYYHIEALARKFEEHSKKIVSLQSMIRAWIARTEYFHEKWRRDKAAVNIQSSEYIIYLLLKHLLFRNCEFCMRFL